jgi:hypothetical protein
MIKSLQVVDNLNNQGDEIDSTIYDEEGDEFDDEEEEGN